jgi:hypothetical protein
MAYGGAGDVDKQDCMRDYVIQTLANLEWE